MENAKASEKQIQRSDGTLLSDIFNGRPIFS